MNNLSIKTVPHILSDLMLLYDSAYLYAQMLCSQEQRTGEQEDDRSLSVVSLAMIVSFTRNMYQSNGYTELERIEEEPLVDLIGSVFANISDELLNKFPNATVPMIERRETMFKHLSELAKDIAVFHAS